MKLMVPNILIKEIDVFDGSGGNTGIRITTAIRDQFGEKWSDLSVFENMKVLMVISSDKSLNTVLENGSIIFNESVIRKNFNVGENIKIFNQSVAHNRRINLGEEILFMGEYDTIFDSSKKDIRVFCAVYLDMPGILGGLNTEISGVERMYGSIRSEIILENGKVNKQTNVFLLPDNNQYIGPVHQHPKKGYMVGGAHTNTPHAVLQDIKVQNYKIKDYRNADLKMSNVKGGMKTSKFSKISYSVNSQGNISGIFAINFKEIIFRDTKYGSYMNMLSKDAIRNILNRMEIKNFEIFRKREDTQELVFVDAVKGFRFDYSGVLNASDRSTENLSFAEIPLSGDNGVKMFYFIDQTIDKTTLGTYTYEIRINYLDPTVSFIEEYISSLRNAAGHMREYINIFEAHRNYNYDTKQTKENFYQNQYTSRADAGATTPPWIIANEIYVRGMCYIYNIRATKKREMLFSNASKIDPRNANLFSLNDFNNKLLNLSSNFERIFNLSNNILHPTTEQTFVKTPNSRNIITIEHVYKQAITPMNFNVSYKYFNHINNPGDIMIFSKKQLLDRTNLEINKFFKSQPKPSDISNLEYNRDLINLQTNKSSYLSPVALNNSGLMLHLTDISKIDINEVNKFFNKKTNKNTGSKNIFASLLGTPFGASVGSLNNVIDILLDQQDEATPPASEVVQQAMQDVLSFLTGMSGGSAFNTLGGSSPTVPAGSVVSTGQEGDEFLSSSEYLGDDSLFVRYSELPDLNSPEENLPQEIEDQIQEILNTDLETANVNEYNALFNRNLINIAKEILDVQKFNKFFQSLPNQIRALFLYRFSFVKKLQGPTDLNIAENVFARAAVNMNYMQIASIEVFEGFGKNRNNNDNISEMKFRLLTNKDLTSSGGFLLCRLKRFYSPELKIKRDLYSFPLENQFFIINLNNASVTESLRAVSDLYNLNTPGTEEYIRTEIENLSLRHNITKRYDLSGATSNIVSQTGALSYTKPNDGSGGIAETQGYTKPNDGSGGYADNAGTTGFNEAVGNINRITGGGGSTGGGY